MSTQVHPSRGNVPTGLPVIPASVIREILDDTIRQAARAPRDGDAARIASWRATLARAEAAEARA